MKNYKTSSKEVRTAIRKHVKAIVENENGNSFKKFENSAKHFYNDFNKNANYTHNINRLPNDVQRFADYLQGLPFAVTVPMYSENLETFLNGLGINNEKKVYSYERMLNLYAMLIYREITK